MSASTEQLITGGHERPLVRYLRDAIRRAQTVDIAVAFVAHNGLGLLLDELAERLTDPERPATVRVLTSDYLGITEPEALRQLQLLQERGADTRLYRTAAATNPSFHLKAYIFTSGSDDANAPAGEAFVGSSNLTRTALTTGLEWNYRIRAGAPESSAAEAAGLAEIRRGFQALLDDPASVPLSHELIRTYADERNAAGAEVLLHPEAQHAEPTPTPTAEQRQALAALAATREAGYRRGLVVMATGLGKTYLAAFDAARMGARRVLFVAHREEILLQAERTFQTVFPDRRVGHYRGGEHDTEADLLFASVQTLSRKAHRERFAPEHFDYVIVDEFHHAAAATYRKLLAHFQPRFLLGLTATPDRADRSDILSLCDDNLVYSRDLFDGIEAGLLCPFTYYGIHDEHVDYQSIPWRNGQFDPYELSVRLATEARARHALREWREKAGGRTLAFCVAIQHAEFMAEHFQRAGVRAAAVHSRSGVGRDEALEQLRRGELHVLFSVDLFNEGIDVPDADTVMMLRPTDSKVLYLQQIGRGLRTAPGKDRLHILDFIGNHHSFLNKPQALLGLDPSPAEAADFARRAREDRLTLPAGCFVNYDLEIIELLERIRPRSLAEAYEALKAATGRRPTRTEAYHAGIERSRITRQHGGWWALLAAQGDLTEAEQACLERHRDFLREVETTSMTRSFKMILLEALLELDGLRQPPTTQAVAEQSRAIFARRPDLAADLNADHQPIQEVDAAQWHRYWLKNPINAWTGGNTGQDGWLRQQEGHLIPAFTVEAEEQEPLQAMIQELVDYQLTVYKARL